MICILIIRGCSMIIETSNQIELDNNESIALSVLGDIWLRFTNHIPEPQAKVLSEAISVIILADPESDFTNKVVELLLREDIDITNIKINIYELCVSVIIDLLERMGVTLVDNQIEFQDLETLTLILDLFFEVVNYEDLIGIRTTLESTELDNHGKLVRVLELVYEGVIDDSKLEDIIGDVTDVVINTIRLGVREDITEDVQIVPRSIIERLKANVELFKETVVYEHIVNDGQLGSSFESYQEFFKSDIQVLLDNPTPDNMFLYLKTLAGILLMSEVKDSTIKRRLSDISENLFNDLQDIIKVDKIIEGLVLDDD